MTTNMTQTLRKDQSTSLVSLSFEAASFDIDVHFYAIMASHKTFRRHNKAYY